MIGLVYFSKLIEVIGRVRVGQFFEMMQYQQYLILPVTSTVHTIDTDHE